MHVSLLVRWFSTETVVSCCCLSGEACQCIGGLTCLCTETETSQPWSTTISMRYFNNMKNQVPSDKYRHQSTFPLV